jgi:hypothetical protein
MTEAQQLRTVRQMAAELKSTTGGFSEGSLRWLIFNCEKNGLDKVLVRVGRKVFIDTQRFNAWLEWQRRRGGVQTPKAKRAEQQTAA